MGSLRGARGTVLSRLFNERHICWRAQKPGAACSFLSKATLGLKREGANTARRSNGEPSTVPLYLLCHCKTNAMHRRTTNGRPRWHLNGYSYRPTMCSPVHAPVGSQSSFDTTQRRASGGRAWSNNKSKPPRLVGILCLTDSICLRGGAPSVLPLRGDDRKYASSVPGIFPTRYSFGAASNVLPRWGTNPTRTAKTQEAGNGQSRDTPRTPQQRHAPHPAKAKKPRSEKKRKRNSRGSGGRCCCRYISCSSQPIRAAHRPPAAVYMGSAAGAAAVTTARPSYFCTPPVISPSCPALAHDEG